MSSAVYLIVALSVLTLMLIFVLIVMYILVKRIPPRMRINMDDVPKSLKKIWWLVEFFRFYFAQQLPAYMIYKRKKKLEAAGLEFFLQPQETFSLQALGAIAFFLLGMFASVIASFDFMTTLLTCIILMIIGWSYPLMWLMDQEKKRGTLILKSIPAFLDILTLCCECGLNVNSGIVNYCEKGPLGPLRSEMERALRDMKGGATRVEALTKTAQRMSNPDMAMFVSIVSQCERLGVPLGSALRRFSEQKRAERFQRAEKLAMEAPMKIIGPLVIFIFPITFIIIAFPIASSMMENFK